MSEEFLTQYKDIRPRNAGLLFEPTYYRTYSRFVPELGRRERWNETLSRVVNYNISLYSGHKKDEQLVEEAEDLYDRMFNLEVYPAGRTFWIGGTKAVEQYEEANFNCCTLILDSVEKFCETFHVLMLGSGCGFRILKEDVEKLPVFTKNFNIHHREYTPHYPDWKIEETEFSPWGHSEPEHDIIIGDSKKGWVDALRHFLTILTNEEKYNWQEESPPPMDIVIDYDAVRPAGERINTFGGRAAGPKGLMEMFTLIEDVVKSSTGKLTPTEVMDILNIIAKNVLVGGVRRSSQIALGSEDDDEFIDAKLNYKSKGKRHRNMSNNSVVFFERPSKEKIASILDRIRSSWEPGLLNFEAASKRRPRMAAINPCGEHLGSDRSSCNLSGIVLPLYIKDKQLNLFKLGVGIRAATRLSMRITNVNHSIPAWDENQKKERLLGVSMTGIMDALDELEWEFDSPEAIKLWQFLHDEANDEADEYSKELGIPRPLLVTILKPEGSISQLTTVSSGLHRSHAPYYIRRIRVSEIDPAAKAWQIMGIKNEPDLEKPDRLVFSFPIKTKAKTSTYDESARRQYERYLTLMKYYVDHNASCTISVGEDEWDEMKELLYENWDETVACAFSTKCPNESQYKQLPYEQITKEQYNEMILTFPDLSVMGDIIDQLENGEYVQYEPEVDCRGGFCATR